MLITARHVAYINKFNHFTHLCYLPFVQMEEYIAKRRFKTVCAIFQFPSIWTEE